MTFDDIISAHKSDVEAARAKYAEEIAKREALEAELAARVQAKVLEVVEPIFEKARDCVVRQGFTANIEEVVSHTGRGGEKKRFVLRLKLLTAKSTVFDNLEIGGDIGSTSITFDGITQHRIMPTQTIDVSALTSEIVNVKVGQFLRLAFPSGSA
jgi:hypothetical protein